MHSIPASPYPPLQLEVAMCHSSSKSNIGKSCWGTSSSGGGVEVGRIHSVLFIPFFCLEVRNNARRYSNHLMMRLKSTC